MKHPFCLAIVILSIAVAYLYAPAADLDPLGPPGSVAARMPTLTQIEPRQIIESIPFTITNSGPFVLTRNLTATSNTDGITIQAGSVTLDLNGFTLMGKPGAGDAISVSGTRSFVIVRNGVLSGWPQCGLDGASANNSKAEDLLVVGNGSYGIRFGTNCTISRCTAVSNALQGFTLKANSIILESIARGNSGIGFAADIGCVIQKCVADRNGSNGFDVQSVGQISHCTAMENTGRGFQVTNCCSVLDSCAYGNSTGFWGWDGVIFSRCVAYLNTFGLYAAKSCSFSGCTAYSNTWSGVYGDVGCSIENCTAYGNSDGIGARNGSKIGNSSSYANRGSGFWIGHSTSLNDCSAMSNSNGVQSQASSLITRNNIRGNSAAGIFATELCRIEQNHITYCGKGIQLTGIRNLVSGNTLLYNSTDYDIVDGNQMDIIISELPFTIPWPANATLAGTLGGVAGYNGIRINSSDVTLDLGGHALVGAINSISGVSVASGAANVEIRNGIVRNWGSWGIDAGTASSISVSDMRAFTNGFVYSDGGILLGTNCVVRGCIAMANKTQGIQVEMGGRIVDCTAGDNGQRGIYATRGATITGCTVVRNVYDGIFAYYGCTVSKCTAMQNVDDGIQAQYHNTIESCTLSENGGDGLYALQDNQVRNNTCCGNGTTSVAAGIRGASTDNTIDGNSTTDNDYGILDSAGGNLIIRNQASGNSTNNFSFQSSSKYGPIVTGTGEITSLNPWANFSF